MLDKLKRNKGFSIIEVMITLFLFSLITLTFYSTFTIGINYILESKNRLGALGLAREKMEIVRNLEYIDIGTVNGVPSGDLPQEEDVVSGGKSYHVSTLIQYFDDELDGTAGDDDVPSDYKVVKITVSWGSEDDQNKKVSLISNFASMSKETDEGNGILSINISEWKDEGLVPVQQASVRIVNNYLSPTIDTTIETDDSGGILFLNAPPDAGGYELSVSKNGYESVSTIDPSSVDYTPIDDNATVVEGYVNPKSIIIDKLADIQFYSVDNFGNSISDVSFHLEGGRILGTRSSVSPPETVYEMDSDLSTNSSGEEDINDHSPGNFYFSDWEDVSGYTFIGISPFDGYLVEEDGEGGYDKYYYFNVSPEEEENIEIKYVDDNEDSLIVKVSDNSDDAMINGAEVTLSNISGYNQTVTTSYDGVAFFPDGSTPLVSGDYSLEVDADGYDSETIAIITISGITNQEVELDSSS